MSTSAINNGIDIKDIQHYSAEIKKALEIKYKSLKLSINDKVNSIIDQYHNNVNDLEIDKKDFQDLIEIILTTSPAEKIQNLMKNFTNEARQIFLNTLERLYNIVGTEVREKIDMEKLTTTLDRIFFDSQKINTHYQSVQEKYDDGSMTKQDYLSVVNAMNDKVISNKEWQEIIDIIDPFKYTFSTQHKINILRALFSYTPTYGLKYGIHSTLGASTIQKHFPDKVAEIVEALKKDPSQTIGLAITEIGSGSNPFGSMESEHYYKNGKCHFDGNKRYQGLTGEARWWLVSSKEKSSGKYEILFVDTQQEGVNITVEELYEMDCLHGIAYGETHFHGEIDEDCVLKVSKEDPAGFRAHRDILTTSKLHFAAMMEGHIIALSNISQSKANIRKVGGGTLSQKPDTIKDLNKISTYKKITNFINQYIINIGIDFMENNGKHSQLSAIIKTLSSEYAVKAGELAGEIQGGDFYQAKYFVSSSTKSIKPFKTFEGPNRMHYTQIKGKGPSKKTIGLLEQSNILFDINNPKLIKQLSPAEQGQIYARIELLNMFLEISVENKEVYNLIITEIEQTILEGLREAGESLNEFITIKNRI